MDVLAYIEVLRRFCKEHGNIEVRKYMPDGRVVVAGEPQLREMRINNPRQTKEVTFDEGFDKPNQKGKEICQI